MNFTVIAYYDKNNGKCGYCKGENCCVSHGMHAYNMMPQDYQDLIDRGWRRSGHYCYKPHQPTTCCPSYTIKCDALEFKLSKSHKKILKRMNRFLRDGKKDKHEEDEGIAGDKADTDTDAGGGGRRGGGDRGGGFRDEPQAPNVHLPDVDLDAVVAANPVRHAAATKAQQQNAPIEIVNGSANAVGAANVVSTDSADSSKKSFDGLHPPCKKAKQIRLERRQAKLAAKGISVDDMKKSAANKQNKEKTIADFLAEAGPNDKHKLTIILKSSRQLNISDEAFNLYCKYQKLIHNDKPERLTRPTLQRFLYKSPLQLKLILAKNVTRENLTDTFALYKKYQTRVHNDPPEGLNEYLDFLQDSPLQLTKTRDGPASGYGSFHQQYWLDDKLIAVGVIDILPSCVSSVYFFYDPDYSFLSLGTYASLREIEFVQQLSRTTPALKYYYMGFYIHSCPKMRYKGKLVPSYLLCPETYTWHLLTDEILAKLDKNKYQRLHPDPSAKDANEFNESHLDTVLLLTEESQVIPYREYKQSFNIERIDNMLDILRSRIYKEITGEDDDREAILQYGKLVGRECVKRILYFKT